MKTAFWIFCALGSAQIFACDASASVDPCTEIEKFADVTAALEKNDQGFADIDWTKDDFENTYRRKAFLINGNAKLNEFGSELEFVFDIPVKVEKDARGMTFLDLSDALKSNETLRAAFGKDKGLVTLTINTRDLYEEGKSTIFVPERGYGTLKAQALLQRLCPQAKI